MRLYLDSNVLISYVRDEMDHAFNLQYKDCEEFFSLCRTAKLELVISELFLQEVKKIVSLEKKDIEELFDLLGIQIVLFGETDKRKAIQISKETGIHEGDATHIVNAVESDSYCIITWNKKDFGKASRIISCYTPNEFIEDIL